MGTPITIVIYQPTDSQEKEQFHHVFPRLCHLTGSLPKTSSNGLQLAMFPDTNSEQVGTWPIYCAMSYWETHLLVILLEGEGAPQMDAYSFTSVFTTRTEIQSHHSYCAHCTQPLCHMSALGMYSLSVSLNKHFNVIIRRYHMAVSHSSLTKNFTDVCWMVLLNFI